MPKLLKILRGRKQSVSGVPTKNNAAKTNGIFRRSAHHRSGKVGKTSAEDRGEPSIVPAITFSLSDDEIASDIVHSPVSDIENQVQEMGGETTDSIEHFEDVGSRVSKSSAETNEISVGTDDVETITFTHLELMRNELAHMMQLAEKDEEIYALRQNNDKLQLLHEEGMKQKNEEISKIREALKTVEIALSEAEGKLSCVNEEHTKVIEVLMRTQYELYEIKHNSPSSWMTPVLSFFDFN